MLRKASRRLLKNAMWFARVKTIYSRVTLTKWTTMFFFQAVLSCLILAVVQSISLKDNYIATDLISELLEQGNVTKSIIIFDEREQLFKSCDDIPGSLMDNCVPLQSAVLPRSVLSVALVARDEDEDDREDSDDEDADYDDERKTEPVAPSSQIPPVDASVPQNTQTPSNIPTPSLSSQAVTSATQGPQAKHTGSFEAPHISGPMTILSAKDNQGRVVGASVSGFGATAVVLDQTCLESLIWLDHIFRNSKREDAVTIVYDIWIMSLSVMAILNESMLHLAAALGAHTLGTAWVGSTVSASLQLEDHYHEHIVGKTCPVDVLGDWWQMKHNATYIAIALNVVATLLSFILASKLYKVYSKDTFDRVGSLPAVHKAYTLVLLHSVLLQLSGFFLISWTAVLIDKVINGLIADRIRHSQQYIAFSVILALIIVPWLVLGWNTVRKEQRNQFYVFGFLTTVIIAFSSSMFTSPVYRFLFTQWNFFAALSVTSYVLVTITAVLSILCRLNFDKGLKDYLQAQDAPEGMDFTPVVIPRNDLEKATTHRVSFSRSSSPSIDEKKYPLTLDTTLQPELAYLPKQRPLVHSVYSDPTRQTVKISSTPSIAQSPSPLKVANASDVTDDGISSVGDDEGYPVPTFYSYSGPPVAMKKNIGLPSNPKARF